ncbi:MAG: flagellar biosynthetic protein FliO [Planctomycetales bacterium]|nr:flagellar biosynthetic protein FliO [Planctomycetales bacterium]
MLPRLLILTLLLATAESASAQESHRSSSYGPPSRRAVQPATFVDDGAASPDESPSATPDTKESPKAAPLRLSPRNKSAAKELTHPSAASPTSAITTVLGSLGIVLGLFVALVWFSRRFAPAGTAALPKEAVELLGRTSLGGNQQMQLVRVGAKLLLVALSPQGARTLTEITSAAEVERLSELCRRQKPESSTASFRTLVDQIGGERTSNTFVDNNRHAPAAATATTRTRATARA